MTRSPAQMLGFRSAENYLGEKAFDDLAIVKQRFHMQNEILRSAAYRFDSSLANIRTIVQAELFDSELDESRELLKNGFLRAAGVVAGVVLEKHLSQVYDNHKLSIRKKNPSISIGTKCSKMPMR